MVEIDLPKSLFYMLLPDLGILDSFNHRIEVEVLERSQSLEEDVMLGTEAYLFPELGHILKHVDVT